MAVFGRVRNWRVCTRSLYAVVSLLFFYLSGLSLSLPFCCFAPSFAVALVALPLPQDVGVSFVSPPRPLWFLCHPLRMFLRASLVLYRVAFSQCRSPPFTQPFIFREYSSAFRKGDAAERLRRGSLKPLFVAIPLSIDASRFHYVRPFLLVFANSAIIPTLQTCMGTRIYLLPNV